MKPNQAVYMMKYTIFKSALSPTLTVDAMFFREEMVARSYIIRSFV